MAPLVIAVGADPTLLDTGLPVVLANGIAIVQVGPPPVNTSALGVALRITNPIFTVQPRTGGGDRTLSLSARSVAAVPTTLTASVYESSDGGTTWSLHQAGLALVASTVATNAQVLHLVAGLLYQVLVTTLTLGSATSVSVDGAIS